MVKSITSFFKKGKKLNLYVKFLRYSFYQSTNENVKLIDLMLELNLFHMDDTNGRSFCLILYFVNVISSVIQTYCSTSLYLDHNIGFTLTDNSI